MGWRTLGCGCGALTALLLVLPFGVVAASRVPLSHLLADTAFLIENLGELDNQDVGWASRVDEYLALVERTLVIDGEESRAGAEAGDAAARSKRQLPTDPLTTLTKDPQGVYLLRSLTERFNIPATFPNDLVPFSRLESGVRVWYAVALEADGESPQVRAANWLVLYKFMGNRFLNMTRVPTLGATSLAVQEIQGWTYIVAGEREAERREAPQAGSILYRLSLTGSQLVPVQTLRTTFPSDLCFWEYHGNHYLVVASEFNSSGGASADSLVYKWLGEHLDIVQKLPTSGAKAVTAFVIDSQQYLVVVNHVNERGETNIDSVVYRFDVVVEKFVVHQKLRTHAGVAVTFFSMQRARGQDHFLVLANSGSEGPDRPKYFESSSVLYQWTEGFFVPFQSFPLVGPSRWTPFLGARGEVALLAVSDYGLHAFQYDGWRFQELYNFGANLPVGGPGSNAASLRSFVMGSEGLIAIASKQNDGTRPNVFAMHFEKSAPLDSLYGQMFYWCTQQRESVARNSVAELEEGVKNAPKWNDPVVKVNTVTIESNSTISSLTADSIVVEGKVVDQSFLADLKLLSGELKARKQDLARAQDTLNKALKKDGVNIVKGRVVLQDASIHCPGGCVFPVAEVRLLNNEDANDLVRNTIRLDADLKIGGEVRFTKVVVEGDVSSQRVLGETAPLVSRVDTRLVHDLVVEGSVRVDAGLDVQGTVDGVRIALDSVLLMDGNQELSEYFVAENWQIDKLVLHGRVNRMHLDVSQPELPPDVLNWAASPPSHLSVNNVKLQGLLGSVDLDDVVRRALRTKGSQVVTGAHTFSKLSANEFFGPLEGDVTIEQVIRIDKVTDIIPGSVIFAHPLAAGNLTVYKRLNHVQAAADGSLDLLLNAGQAGAQQVVGRKWVRHLEVTEHAKLHGRILGLVLPAEDEPVLRVINEEITVEGDVTISGAVRVGGLLSAPDITEISTGLSVLTVLRDAVTIDSPLPPNVLLDDLTISNVNAERVNGVPAASWIVDSPSAKVELQQPATFTSGLNVVGGSTLNGTVNGVNLVTLANTALRTTGFQVITGYKTFDSISGSNVRSNDTWLGATRWMDVVVPRPLEQSTPHGILKVDRNLVVNGVLNATKILVSSGNLGGIHVQKAIMDSVFEDERMTIIDGPKTFVQTIRVDNLVVGPNVTGTDLTGMLPVDGTPQGAVGELRFTGPVNILRPLSVGRLGFQGTLDGVTDSDWAAPWLEVDGDQTLYGPQTVVGNVHAFAGVRVATKVNGVNLTDFAQQVARIDDPNLRLGTVTLEGGVVSKGPVSAGSVGGVLLEDALLRRSASAQEVRSRLMLAGGLEVMGTLTMEGALSGEMFKDLCAFTQPPPETLNTPQHITVAGDLLLTEEMVLENSVNGQSMYKLLNNTWLRDKPMWIRADMQFGDILLDNSVEVEGRIDGVNLDQLSQRYVSLTADQTITTSLNVARGVEVRGTLRSAGPVDVAGEVGGLKLNELQSRFLLDGVDQDVPGHMSFGNVHTTGDLSLDGTVNGLDLSRDVVRLDQGLTFNRVTEKKVVKGMHVDDLGADTGVRVQGVDLDAWSRSAVRVKGDYTVEGLKTLNHPQASSDITVGGVVNGVHVDAEHLLLRHSDQVVTGSKTIMPAPLPGLGLRVIALDVKGRVNTVDMRQLLTNQAYKGGDVEVESPVELRGALLAHSAQLDGMYLGVNFSDLIYAAQHPPILDQYSAQHEFLLRTAEHVQQSLRAQGYYLNYYHTAVSLRTSVRAVLPLGMAGDPVFAIAVVREENPGQPLVVNFFSWDTEQATIVTHPSLFPVSLPPSVRMIEPARWAGQSAIYWEADESSGVGLHLGHVMGVRRDGQLGVAQVLRETQASGWVTVAELGDLTCLIRGSPGGPSGDDGFCALHCAGSGREDLVQQPLPVLRPMHATVLSVRGVPHVFVATGASEKSDGSVSVWRWEGKSGAGGGAPGSLRLVQTLGVVNASALAAVEYRGILYLATASGHVQDAPHEGMVHVSRYDSGLRNWTHWVSVAVEGPRSLQFATLPSGELVLYVATACPSDNLVVLLYRGVAGFVRRASAAVPLGEGRGKLSAFTTTSHQHVVAVSGGRQAALLQAAFKGSWEASERGFRETLARTHGPN